MDTDLEGERAAFIAGEVGGAVLDLVFQGKEISRDSVVECLEVKRKAVGNVIHKGILRDAAGIVRRGK